MKQEQDNENQLMSANKASKYIGVCFSTFQKLVQRREIGYKIVGKTRRYTKEELDKWLKDTIHPTDCSRETKLITSISLLDCSTETKLSFEKVLEQTFVKINNE